MGKWVYSVWDVGDAALVLVRIAYSLMALLFEATYWRHTSWFYATVRNLIIGIVNHNKYFFMVHWPHCANLFAHRCGGSYVDSTWKVWKIYVSRYCIAGISFSYWFVPKEIFSILKIETNKVTQEHQVMEYRTYY